MIEYGYTPNKNDIDKIMSLSEDFFNKIFEAVKNEHMYGSSSPDAKYAFSADNMFFENRESFCEKYNLNPDKKNIFVMLHAFTDYPHSHFESMLFKDYGDWFLKTLDFAQKDKSVNWIFKQHPSDKFYPTKDIIFSEIFKNRQENVLFFSSEDKLDTRSIGVLGDAVITCAGSAGFEIPAFFGIPSITAGDNFYQGFDFMKKPKNQKEYFNILRNLKNISTLSMYQQKLAKAVYIFLYKVCVVSYSFIPVLTMEDHHNPTLNNVFWDKVLDLYDTNEKQIKEEVRKYAYEVRKDSFKALRTVLGSNDGSEN